MIIKPIIGIYKITNPTGKIYIGQSINIEVRLKSYKKKLTKTDGAVSLRDYYNKGWSPEAILGHIARGIGLNKDLGPVNAEDLIHKYESYNWDKHYVSSREVLHL